MNLLQLVCELKDEYEKAICPAPSETMCFNEWLALKIYELREKINTHRCRCPRCDEINEAKGKSITPRDAVEIPIKYAAQGSGAISAQQHQPVTKGGVIE